MTGAARGIGYAIAQSLGREGAAVVVSDVDETAALASVSNLKQQGIHAAFVHCDVADSQQVSSCTHRLSSMRVASVLQKLQNKPAPAAELHWRTSYKHEEHTLQVSVE